MSDAVRVSFDPVAGDDVPVAGNGSLARHVDHGAARQHDGSRRMPDARHPRRLGNGDLVVQHVQVAPCADTAWKVLMKRFPRITLGSGAQGSPGYR
jgi:hypothetical protein